MADDQFTNVTEDGYYVHPFNPIGEALPNMDYYLEVDKDRIILSDLGFQDRLTGLDINLRIPFFAYFMFGNEVDPMFYFDFDVEIKIVGKNIEGLTEHLSLEETLKCYRADDGGGRTPDTPIVLNYSASANFHLIIAQYFTVGDINLEINVYTKGYHKDPKYGTKIIIPIDISNCESLKPAGDLYVDKGAYPPFGDITPEDWGFTKGVSNISVGGHSLSFKSGAFFKDAYIKLFKENDTSNPIKEFTIEPGADPTAIKSFGKLLYTDDMEVGNYKIETGFSDSRNFSVSENFEITLFGYTPPTIDEIKVRRCDVNGEIDNQGSYFSVNVGYTIDQTQPNDITYFVVLVYDRNEKKTISENVWAGTPTQNPIIAGDDRIKVDNSYNVEVWLNDKVDRDLIKKSVIEDTAYSTLDFLAGGKGISFGIDAYKEGFQCAMDAEFNNSVVMENGINVAGGNTTLNGTLNVAQATNLKNGLTVTGNASTTGNLTVSGVIYTPVNNQIYQNGARTYCRIYQSGNTTAPYHAVISTGTLTANNNDWEATLLVQEHYMNGNIGILHVAYRANEVGTAGGGSIMWLVNNGWGNDRFTLKTRTTSGNATADLWVKLDAWQECSVTVLDAGSRGSRNYNRFYLINDSQSGAGAASIPTAARDGKGNYNQTLNPTISGGMSAHYANGYWGLMNPVRSSTDWIRTTSSGLIPFKAGGGSSSLGTSSWPFNNIYSQHQFVGPNGGVEQVKDVVVAEGESNGWVWRKWASGVAEIIGSWKNVNIGASTTDNWHWISYAPPVSAGNWPFTFYQSGPAVVLNIEDLNSRYWPIRTADSTTASPVITPVTAQGYGAQAIGVVMYARGYWRARNFNRI